MIRYFLSAITLVLGMSNTAASNEEWSTAISKHQTEDKTIVFRYLSKLPVQYDRKELSERVVLVWKYQGMKGMPSTDERQLMDQMEDLLALIEKRGVAKLVMVSTGNNLREWTYYATSKEIFLSELNVALHGKAAFPIEIHIGKDPSWSTYENFKSGVVQK